MRGVCMCCMSSHIQPPQLCRPEALSPLQVICHSWQGQQFLLYTRSVARKVCTVTAAAAACPTNLARCGWHRLCRLLHMIRQCRAACRLRRHHALRLHGLLEGAGVVDPLEGNRVRACELRPLALARARFICAICDDTCRNVVCCRIVL